MTDNAARMSYNPPSTHSRPVKGPVGRVVEADDDGAAWRAENDQRSIERAQINGQ